MSFNDQYRPSGFGYLPVVTKNIIIINVLVFALTYFLDKTQHIDLNQYLGLHHHSAPDFKPHQFITYLFMHGNIPHLFFNTPQGKNAFDRMGEFFQKQLG